MWEKLARQPLWTESLPPETKARFILKILAAMEQPDIKPRALASLAKTLTHLQRMDLDMSKHELEVQAAQGGISESAEETQRRILDANRAIREAGGA
jgi:hypothetical protein